MSEEIQSLWRSLYAEVADFYASKVAELGPAAAGYEILYGPALVHPELIFLGDQPGGSGEDAAPGLETGTQLIPPVRSVYADANWRLARRMQDIWGKTALEKTTGLNVNFFRAPSAEAWQRVPADLRHELEEFSRARAERLVRGLGPSQMIVIGLGTFRKLAGSEVSIALRGARSEFVRRGVVWEFGPSAFPISAAHGSLERIGPR